MATDAAGPYWAAREYIKLCDHVRLYSRLGWDPTLAMVEHLNQARARLDEALPSARVWRGWSERRPWHNMSIHPAQKMDTPVGLFKATCSCGYESGVDSEKGAFTSGAQHVQARVKAGT